MKKANQNSVTSGVALGAVAAASILVSPAVAAPDRIAKTYKAWTVQCVNLLDSTGLIESSECELFQEIVEQTTGGRVLRISLLPNAETQGATAIFLTPSGVDLHKYFSWTTQFDDKEAELREDLFKTCQANGCSAIFDLKPDALESLLGSDALDVAFSFPAQADPVQISVSPNGLREAFEDLTRAD